ncbi:cytochrome P450 [Streptomyces wedmorensis]|uniref:cytochrome P450 n=1 Tax=Streptomyces wedmorensis TaxID=43759 RepID=UPI00379E89AE
MARCAERSERLTDTEIVHLSLAVLVAGHETTVNAIGSGVWRLFQEPEALAALRADPDLLPGAVDELLRFQPQGATFRMLVAREDVVIRAGEGVMPLPFIANRDPRRFTDPDRFDIRRTGNRHIAFGHGPHACFGAVLARTELEVALGTLLRRFPGLRPAQPPESLPCRMGQLMGALLTLPVTW